MIPKQLGREATYQDVLDAPDNVVAEIVDGELFLSPRPRTPHAIAMTALTGELYAPFGRGRGGPGGWVFMDEPELHFGKTIVVPDIAGWRRDRLPVVEDLAYLELPPDWIAEGLSRSTEKLDRTKKMRAYAKAGVQYAWLVDARIRMLETYRLHDGKWLLLDVFTDADKIRAQPFEELEIELANLWTDLPSRAGEAAAEYG